MRSSVLRLAAVLFLALLLPSLASSEPRKSRTKTDNVVLVLLFFELLEPGCEVDGRQI